MGLLLLAAIVVALSMTAMAVGVIFSNRCLRGSCGGAEALGPGGERLTCETCPLRVSGTAATVAAARRDESSGDGGR